MYINTELLLEKDLTPTELVILQLIHQNRTEEVANVIAMTITDETLQKFEERNFVEYIKGKKSQSEFEKIRLSKKGKKLLEDLQTPIIKEEDIVVYDWLRDLYLKADKEIGSESKCKRLIAWFRTESGINKNRLITLCKEFTQDEDRMEYSKVLQFVFWRPENHFQTSPKLEDSKLWLYYEKYRDKFDKLFETI